MNKQAERQAMLEFKPYTADLKLSDYNLNDLLPKIWRDGYERRDRWIWFDISRWAVIEIFKILYLPAKLILVYYILMP